MDCFVFWRRILAYVVDSIILAIFAYIFCFSLFDFMDTSSILGALIALVLIMFYFGLMQSSLCNGQTLGKKLLKIKVVTSEGEYLSLKKSMLRAFVYSLYFILNSISFALFSPAFFIQVFITIFLCFVNILLFIFNTPSRQLIHDFVAGTCVVRTDCININIPESKKKFVISGIVLFFSIVICILPLFSPSVKLASQFEKVGFKLTNVTFGHSVENNVKYSAVGLGFTVKNAKLIADKDYYINAAKKALEIMPEIYNAQNLEIMVMKRVTIGSFASLYKSGKIADIPKNWAEAVSPALPLK